MEQRPHNPDDDRERNIPELERFYAGEIDLTGVVRQDDALVDVIGDAIGEAEDGDGEVPEWGARTLARALANERDDPLSGALHHFAVTGRADTGAISRELAELYAVTADEEIKTWVAWLSVYIVKLADIESQIEPTASPKELHPDATGGTTELEIRGAAELERGSGQEGPSPDDPSPEYRASTSGPAGRLTEYLRRAQAEADARGETLGLEHVQAIAAMLTGFLVVMGVDDSAMIRLAEFGDVDQLKLHDECQQLKAVVWKIPDVSSWVEQLERYLERHGDNPQVSRGLRDHGDAFRAYLQLPDVQPQDDDLLASFREVYIGSFTSIRELLNELTDLKKGLAAVAEAAEGWGFEEFVTLNETALTEAARSTWDIVEHQGRLHVFAK